MVLLRVWTVVLAVTLPQTLAFVGQPQNRQCSSSGLYQSSMAVQPAVTNEGTNAAKETSVTTTKTKPHPRVLKSVRPFSSSRLESEYLASVALRVNHYTMINSFAFSSEEKLGAPDSFLDKLETAKTLSARAPRILSMLRSPQNTRVKEGVKTVDSSGLRIIREAASTAIVERVAYLILEDLDNVRKGIYPLPSELRLINQATFKAVPPAIKEFFNLCRFTNQDTYSGQVDYSAPKKASNYLRHLSDGVENLPDYYVNDFHSVPGGFLAPEHVKVYDQLSEVVFLGTHLLGRRMMLPPIAEAMKKKSRTGKFQLLDVGTGTGTFLTQVHEAFPNVELSGIDLSPAMIAHAKNVCQSAGVSASLKQGNMEGLPHADESFDFVTQSNCFHEMPEHAIRNAAMEFARVLKPGGLLIHHDAMQMADDPSIAQMARPAFDKNFNEPYMQDWQNTVDLDDIMAQAGLRPTQAPKPLYASCMRVYEKGDQ